ncbi:uncharacterized protein EI90DRAFT_3057639 [Cantharellus anzutake]|uniref:uncharacterized protein n=1 Tax=Cantharellus anzutake TaxID=1750568 RepID=UPI001908FBC9|nr:uncharacterized protein EI90DRAFT_3057639 [Cantharellus anzutake]KAF8331353.1 hypothetical protein EI90DRAFT_3057639 [Cantharellus anzutake]
MKAIPNTERPFHFHKSNDRENLGFSCGTNGPGSSKCLATNCSGGEKFYYCLDMHVYMRHKGCSYIHA